jgi:hypothetical protein
MGELLVIIFVTLVIIVAFRITRARSRKKDSDR